VAFLIFIIVVDIMKEIKAKEIRQRARKQPLQKSGLPYTSVNYWLFALGVAIIIAGYVALAQPPADSFLSVTVAPILLVMGYCVIIPIAILYQKKKSLEPTNGKKL
jgi:uncharacterized membrane protein HdeD (DUF308 family)